MKHLIKKYVRFFKVGQDVIDVDNFEDFFSKPFSKSDLSKLMVSLYGLQSKIHRAKPKEPILPTLLIILLTLKPENI